MHRRYRLSVVVLLGQSLQNIDSFTTRTSSPFHSLWVTPPRSVLAATPTPAESSPLKEKSAKKHSRKKRRPNNNNNKEKLERWRIFDVKVHPDDLIVQSAANNTTVLPPAVHAALARRLRPVRLESAVIVRRSLDARVRNTRRNGDAAPSSKHASPMYVYTIDVDVWMRQPSKYKKQKVETWKEQPGRRERIVRGEGSTTTREQQPSTRDPLASPPSPSAPVVLVVGAGPAGLLCALELVQQQGTNIRVILLEQGQPVEQRGRAIGALMHRRVLDAHSNFCFGEGGAGTWSDGKLTTRIGRNAGPVRQVLETLVQYGAPPEILVEGAPHLGTDNLVRLLRRMREELVEKGVEIRFGTKVTELILEEGAVQGVAWESVDKENSKMAETGRLMGNAVVLATGHSSRETYEQLHASGVKLESKGFAMGFRVEHPQKLITKIQYGSEWGGSVITGKKITDETNSAYFEELRSSETPRHVGKLPVPSYRLATQYANDGTIDRGCYSFCMCPGGQIVPASTNPDEVCVNGMSFSRRDSPFANSALVVSIAPDDSLLEPYRQEHGVLAGIAFQRDMERRAAQMGGGDLTVPVQCLTDFLDGRSPLASSPSPPSSYRLGVKPSPCHELYPEAINHALRHSLLNHFEKTMPGFVSEHGVLHGVETRTSSPLRIPRDADTLEAVGTTGLFPSGEGAGFAGGIVSAAVDGLHVAHAVQQALGLGSSSSEQLSSKSQQNMFHY